MAQTVMFLYCTAREEGDALAVMNSEQLAKSGSSWHSHAQAVNLAEHLHISYSNQIHYTINTRLQQVQHTLLNPVHTTAIMVKKRASKYVTDNSQPVVAELTQILVDVTRKAVATSSPLDAQTARDAHQKTRRSRDSQSATWSSRQPFVCYDWVDG